MINGSFWRIFYREFDRDLIIFIYFISWKSKIIPRTGARPCFLPRFFYTCWSRSRTGAFSSFRRRARMRSLRFFFFWWFRSQTGLWTSLRTRLGTRLWRRGSSFWSTSWKMSIYGYWWKKPRDLDRDRLLSLDFSRLREFERERLCVSLRDFESERVRLLRRRLSRESDLLWRRRRRSRLLDLLLRLSLLEPPRGSLILMDPGAR